MSNFLFRHRKSGPVILTVVFMAMSASVYADRPAALSAQTIKSPSGPASLKGLGESFSPNMSTGTGNFSVPIEVAPGIVKPSVTLTYTGGKGKSELGMSFRLPVLNIYRTTDKGAPDFDEYDRFAVEGPSLNDELVLVNAEKRWYRLRNEGAFALFVRDAEKDTWTIRMPDGNVSYLGENLSERQTAGGRSFRWYISRYADKFNHEIHYKYFEDLGRIYLEEIVYQLEAPADYQNRIVFNYEDRPDVFSDYTYGSKATTAYRMSSIEVFHGGRRMRIYRLTYEDAMLFSLLSAVEMEGENGLKMPTLSFQYVAPSPDSGGLTTMSRLPPLEGLMDGLTTLEDMNGDGLPDMLYGKADEYKYYENIDGYQWSERPIEIDGSPDRSLYQEDTLLTDVDGDGFRDVIYAHRGEFRYFPGGDIKDGKFLGYGEARSLSTVEQPPYHFGSSEVKMTDLNSDGRIDLLYQKAGQDIQVINTKENRLEERFLEADFPLDVDFTDPNLQLTDFNGDGVLDFVLKEINSVVRRVRVWFGLGHGRYSAEQQMRGIPELGNGDEFYIQDINGDSQADLVRISGNWVGYHLNDGAMGYTVQKGEFDAVPATVDTKKILFADMNGNGTTDIVWLTQDWKLKYMDLFKEPNFGLLKSVDNGMGMVTTITYRSSTEFMIDDKLAGEPWKLPMPHPVPVIEEIATTDSLDAIGFSPTITRTTFEYRDGYWDTKEREFRGFAQAVSTSDGDEFHETGVTETWMHVGRNLTTGEDEESLKGKPWLQLTKDSDGNLYTSVETNWEQRWFCQENLSGVAEKILPNCAAITDKESHKEDLIVFAVQTEALTGSWEKTDTPKWTATSSQYNEWGAAVRSETWGEVTFAGSRTPGDKFDLDQANLYVGEDEVVNETDFIYNVENWLLSLPLEARVYDIAGVLQSSTKTYYDGADFVGLSYGQVTRGLPTRNAAWLQDEDGERWIDSKRMAYNDDGLVVATMDANDNVVELDYDLITGQFPVTERFFVEMGALEFTAEYDTGYGAIISATDLNDNTSRFYYDGLGRLTDIVDPLGTISKPTTHYDYQYGTPENPISITTTRSLVDRNQDTYRTAWQFSDGLGRGRLTKTEAEEEFGFIGSGWTKLSSRGTATHTYDSFPSKYSGFEAAPSNAPVTISYFDALGRAVQVTPPGTEAYGMTSTITQYRPFETWVYDERDTFEGTWLYPAVTKVDGQGRVREILKHNDIDDKFVKLLWQVDYNTLGGITGFTDPKGNTRHYGYDSLQRMRWVNDPNVNTIEYAYDDVGNLLTRVDALGQIQRFEYGLANRLLTAKMQNAANGEDYSYTYHYDEPSDIMPDATNTKGKLSSVEWPTGTHQASYDELDRLVEETQTLWDGVSDHAFQTRDKFTQKYEYNAGGELLSQEAPGGLHLDFRYNQRSLLSRVAGGFDADKGSIFSGIRYDHRGAARQTDARNGTSTCSWYDNRARLVGMMSGPIAEISCDDNPKDDNDAAFHHLTYNRTPTGLIKTIADHSPVSPGIPRFHATYEYDRLYQLKGAHTPEGQIDYRYDTIQNLVSRTLTDPISGSDELFENLPTGDFGYGENGAGPNQITSAGKQRFEYNAIGQMKQYNGFDLTFDVESRLVKAEKSGKVSIEYHYDDTGEKKLTIIEKPNQPDRIYRYVSGGYQIRDGNETWFVSGGQGQVEISKSKGLDVTLQLLEEMTDYVRDPEGKKKPVPAEYMDLDGDGDFLDIEDLDVATEGYWDNKPVGGEQLVYRYYHKDHLGGSTVVTDSMGDVVSTMRYHPYGQTAFRSGEMPIYGFAGGEVEEESELGLIRYGARWYAPAVGRWVNGDTVFFENPVKSVSKPLESGAYSYAQNDPINKRDPGGTASQKVVRVVVDLNNNRLVVAYKKSGETAVRTTQIPIVVRGQDSAYNNMVTTGTHKINREQGRSYTPPEKGPTRQKWQNTKTAWGAVAYKKDPTTGDYKYTGRKLENLSSDASSRGYSETMSESDLRTKTELVKDGDTFRWAGNPFGSHGITYGKTKSERGRSRASQSMIHGNYGNYEDPSNYRNFRSSDTDLGGHGCIRIPNIAAKWLYDGSGGTHDRYIVKDDTTADQLLNEKGSSLPGAQTDYTNEPWAKHQDMSVTHK